MGCIYMSMTLYLASFTQNALRDLGSIQQNTLMIKHTSLAW